MIIRLQWSLFFFLIVFARASFGQDETISPYLKAWEKSGRDQSYASQVFFDSLRLKKDPASRKKYWRDINKLRHYIDQHPDRRLQVRLMMFEIMAAREHGMQERYYPEVEKAIKLAYPLHDEQLNAELYSIRADVPPGDETYLLYNLKAVEIQEKIGTKYFPFTHNRFFGISAGLYSQKDYTRAIHYGKRFLAHWDKDPLHRDERVFIFQYDLLGSSYLQLEQCDSARRYYHLILERIKSEPDARHKKLWEGIAQGNIAKTYIHEKQYGKASPLLRNYLNTSKACSDTLNIAMAQNAYAAFHYGQNNRRAALAAAQDAWNLSRIKNLNPQMINALKWMTTIYQDTQQYDSAFYCLNLQNKYRGIEREQLKKSEFSTLQAQIDFDKLQNSLVLAEASVRQERNFRSVLITGVVLLAVIIALLYNRKRIKNINRLRELRLQHEAAELKISDARERIALFTNHLIEKNNLIKSLQIDLKNIQSSSAASIEKLLNEPLFTEEGWEKFRVEFSRAYPYFFVNLHGNSDNITPAMERLAALIFLKLDNYQIANSLGIGKDSVARGKRRLRAVLDLPEQDKLESFITALGEK